MFNLKDLFSKKDKYGLDKASAKLLTNTRLDRVDLSDLVVVSRLFKHITQRTLQKFSPDKTRVITRFLYIRDPEHVKRIINRVLSLKDSEVSSVLNQLMKDFLKRHKDIKSVFISHFDEVEKYIEDSKSLSLKRKLLIGAYFTMEYSIESAALFNPSIIVYPKQNDLKRGCTRVVFSFRATGEGHVSSIVFRSAIVTKNNEIYLEPISPFVSVPRINRNPIYDKELYARKLKDLGSCNEMAVRVLDGLNAQFSYNELREKIEEIKKMDIDTMAVKHPVFEQMVWLADSNYEIIFPPRHLISERVIFPVSLSESNGIEDARFVRFVDDDGSVTYYATYTAYNGRDVLPQLIETKDFHAFKISTLNGCAAVDKGMALFPRRINGKYAMISRCDGENLYISYSDNTHFWYDEIKIQEPQRAWEFIKIGNCGSPIETKEGWILLTHGVGPMRKYCIGVELLDLNDPTKIIAKLPEPLISPREKEREGYVPNVVYSCGSILLNDELIIPYATSDSVSSIAIISVDELLEKLLANRV